MKLFRVLLLSIACSCLFSQALWSVPVISAEEPHIQKPEDFIGASRATPVTTKEPPQVAESPNKCEIVSCGMGIKETCQINCPAGQTPKCSCDCIRNIGPLCMEYKANCRCE